MKHISIRVPWHDNKWSGRVCDCPSNNSFCLMLKNICDAKNNEKEENVASKEWCKLSVDELPACKGENGGFMNVKPYKRKFTHVYQYSSSEIPQKSLIPKVIEIPEYSFLGVPFRYLSRETSEYLDERFPNFAEDEDAPFTTGWVFGRQRQYDILNWYRSNITAGESLVVFYCKNGNPVDEDSRRIIIGLGEIKSVNPILEFDSKINKPYPFWELLMSHSIRKDLKQSKGFLIPYHEYLELDETIILEKTGISKNQAIRDIKLTLDKLGNSDKIFKELSYGCEYVSDHSMLIILNAARICLENVKKHGLVGGDWDRQLRWIDEKVAQVKSLIGPFPSFAEGLRSLGFNYAYLIEQDLRNNGYCGVKDNPWVVFDKMLNGHIKIKDAVYNAELSKYKKTWMSISDKTKQVLELLSRFEIDSDTMEDWINDPDWYDKLINNPYLLSEESSYGKITPEMVDIGVIADADIQGEFIPKAPSCIETKIDERRIRAFAIYKLTTQSFEGDTLMSINEMNDYINDFLAKDNLKLPIHFFKTYEDYMNERLRFINDTAVQLDEFYDMESFLRMIFIGRAQKNVKVPLNEDWGARVKSVAGYDAEDERSVRAAETQIRALRMFGEKRLCVLTGAAGTGKTSVVEAFLNSQQIQKEGVLLLAPTGKARVKLGKQSNNGEALTIAQFLTRQGFFDWDEMIPCCYEEGRKYSGSKNIIIDECSMLTTRDFYVLLNALDLTAINRIILIGDPYQLPPIGDGRTFSDLCNYLKKELPDAITSLSIVVRTIHTGDSDILALASWFSGTKPNKDADGIFDKIQQGNLHGDLSVYTWKDESSLKETIGDVLEKELDNKNLPLKDRIIQAIGLNDIEAAKANPGVVENFQVLSPVKNPVWGTLQLNTLFQDFVEKNRYKYFTTIFPNKFYPGDKVIQLKNAKIVSYPSRKEKQLSNGQIGFVNVTKNTSAQVFFSGISNEVFYYNSQRSDDAEQVIDLAYAITIHKSQGSDFNTVLVILPKRGLILSRELIYTALTRAKKKLILLVEENMQWLMDYSKPQQSILARRNTNLFEYSVREEKVSVPFVEGLIHKTLSGVIVRSKSEVIIADALYNEGIKFEYEKLLEENGHHCIPDFTFEDASGDTIIWEHLGLLDNPSYRASWEKKLAFYNSIGYVEGENLLTTRDHEGGSIDSNEIKEVVDKVKEMVISAPINPQHAIRRKRKK